jgi:hypothetical protein
MCVGNALLFSNYQMGFPSPLEMFYICPKVGKKYIIVVNLLIEQGFKVEFETIKWWLVIVEVFQKRWLYKLVGII